MESEIILVTIAHDCKPFSVWLYRARQSGVLFLQLTTKDKLIRYLRHRVVWSRRCKANNNSRNCLHLLPRTIRCCVLFLNYFSCNKPQPTSKRSIDIARSIEPVKCIPSGIKFHRVKLFPSHKDVWFPAVNWEALVATKSIAIDNFTTNRASVLHGLAKSSFPPHSIEFNRPKRTTDRKRVWLV